MLNKLIVCSYSFYPDDKSSEAIVNRNWRNILVKNNTSVDVLSSFYIKYSHLSKEERIIFQKTGFLLKKFSKKKNILGWFIYALLNKAFINFSNSKLSIENYFWIKTQSKNLFNILKEEDVVWARILPVLSIIPVLNAFEKKNFPLIININDPILSEGSQQQYWEDKFLKTKDIAQAWTFPSSQLADKMALKYSLDRKRCFVIPHAMRKVDKLYKRNLNKEKIDFLYTGTFYKSAFTDEFKQNLKSFFKLEHAKFVTFTFVLSQYDEASINWLKESIPNVKLKFKSKREEVLGLIEKSDCMLVVDSILHKELLKGKLVEAISYGIPVLSITYQGSVMDNVVNEYGGISSYQDVEGDITEKFIFISENLRKSDYLKSFYSKRQNVIDKISEEQILKKTIIVSEFALKRFNEKSFSFNELNIAENMQWP